MTTPTEPTIPATLYGLLAAGERTTRPFSCPCPDTHVPMLQAREGVKITEQSTTEVLLENTSAAPAMFLVVFPSREFVKAALAAKELGGFLYRHATRGRK